MQRPTNSDWASIKRTLRYLNGTSHYGLLIKLARQYTVTSFADANWGSDKDDRRSTSGHCTYLGPNIIIWSSKKQHVVARSTTEAEYCSIADVVTEVAWLTALLREMHVAIVNVPMIWCDNSRAVALTANPVLHSKMKHVDLDLHFLREKIADKLVDVGYVPAMEQVADVLTKPLSSALFVYFRTKLNVVAPEDIHVAANSAVHGVAELSRAKEEKRHSVLHGDAELSRAEEEEEKKKLQGEY